MNTKKILGSFFIALIISVLVSFGQNKVLAACTGSIVINNQSSISANKRIDYTITLTDTSSCGSTMSLSLYETNSSTPYVNLPISTSQLTPLKDNAGNTVAYQYTNSLDISQKFPAGQNVNLTLGLKSSSGSSVTNSQSLSIPNFGAADPTPSEAPFIPTNGDPIAVVQENTADGKLGIKYTAVISPNSIGQRISVCAFPKNGGEGICNAYTINNASDYDALVAQGKLVRDVAGNYIIVDKVYVPNTGEYTLSLTDKDHPDSFRVNMTVQATSPYQENPNNPPANPGMPNSEGGNSGGGSSVLGDANTEVLKSLLSALWLFVFPFAVIVAVIKLLINIIQIASSSGNPQALAQAKEEAIATFLGLLLIAGAVTFIRIMGGILGI